MPHSSKEGGLLPQKKRRFANPYNHMRGRSGECGTNATKRAKRRLAGIELFDTGDSPCRFALRESLRGSPRIMVKLTKKFDGRAETWGRRWNSGPYPILRLRAGRILPSVCVRIWGLWSWSGILAVGGACRYAETIGFSATCGCCRSGTACLLAASGNGAERRRRREQCDSRGAVQRSTFLRAGRRERRYNWLFVAT